MRSLKMIAALAASATLACAAPAFAVTTFTTNFDSMSFGTGPGFTTLSSYEGWTGGAHGIEVQYNNVAGKAFSGANLVELDTSANSSMSRLIDAGSYILRYWYSDRPGVPASSNGIAVLLNGVQSFASIGGNGDEQTDWRRQTFAFNVSAPTTLTFAALGTSDSRGGYIDSVSLSAVPEPASWAMMIAGFGMMGFALRNRANAKVAYA
ncbi:PEPxxWA-CTERM sorting domain-containing protein [Sphingomonas sp. TREG-RG-20F-R18-01]|uniref:PEPxxWA-CTERM sorting domain-containing protein n=1 Tax=Sphingomonas sp. TREG-RG-20F-R18-01 TaxID=2914982 RepID=UPI001F59D407|nr:PEPxxWA-CTERM sorting domain-containing protein [Sphingomonas sp. TREG-RG-20F-R18-01]